MSEQDEEQEVPYACYAPKCEGEYFGECDVCGKEGCATHITISSKLARDDEGPLVSLCHDCYDIRQKEYMAAIEQSG